MTTRIRTTDTPGYTPAMTDFIGSSSRTQRSTEMQTMHEALAREHMRQLQDEARRHSLSRKVASAKRWHYVERRAHAVYRHAQRANRAAQLSTVAD